MNLKTFLSLSIIVFVTIFSPMGQADSLGRVLVVLPAATVLSTQEGNGHRTGYFMSELAVPLTKLISVGIKPIFATPNGVIPQIDPMSDDAKWFKSPVEYIAAKRLLGSLTSLAHPRSLESLSVEELSQFDGIFIPGGHAAMEDLPKNKSLGRILNYFHANQKPTASICHGPAALLSAFNKNGSWIYNGYKMTVFSTAEEKQEEDVGALGGHVLFYVQDEFQHLGGQVFVEKPWSANVVKDHELITAQNPMSDTLLTPLFLQSIVENIWIERLAVIAREIVPLRFTHSAENVTTLFVGLKKVNFKGKLSDRLESHVELVRKLTGSALLSYKVFSNDQIEIAVMTWKSAQAKDDIFAKVGKEIGADASEFLDSVLFENTKVL